MDNNLIAKKRYIVLDSFRGLLAFIVAIYHYKSAGPISDFLLIQKGHHFVDFFFVLSGFIIYHNYSNLESGSQQLIFMKNRLFRLYPLHIIMLFLFLLMECMKFLLFNYGLFKSPVFERNNLTSFIVNLFFLQSFNITSISWNYPSWSISAEMVAYLVFCLLAVHIKNINNYYRVPAFLLISTLSLILVRIITGSFDIEITSNFSMFRCMFGFYLGCAVYELHKKINILNFKPIGYTLVETIALSISLLSTMYLAEDYNFLLPVIYSLTIFIFALEKGIFSNFLSHNLFITVGKYSYSIYMTHAAIAIVFEIIVKIMNIKSPIMLSLILVIYIFVIFGFSSVTYKYVEVKFRSFLQTRSATKKLNHKFVQ